MAGIGREREGISGAPTGGLGRSAETEVSLIVMTEGGFEELLRWVKRLPTLGVMDEVNACRQIVNSYKSSWEPSAVGSSV